MAAALEGCGEMIRGVKGETVTPRGREKHPLGHTLGRTLGGGVFKGIMCKRS